MSNQDFWLAVYIAAINAGAGSVKAGKKADAAVAYRQYRWDNEEGADDEQL